MLVCKVHMIFSVAIYLQGSLRIFNNWSMSLGFCLSSICIQFLTMGIGSGEQGLAVPLPPGFSYMVQI